MKITLTLQSLDASRLLSVVHAKGQDFDNTVKKLRNQPTAQKLAINGRESMGRIAAEIENSFVNAMKGKK